MSSPTPPSVWKRGYDDVKMHIPGLTDAVYWQMMYHVLNDFLDRTNLWQETVPIDVVPTSLRYTFTVADQGEPNRLIIVYDPANEDPNPKWVMGGVQMNIPGVLQLNYAPSTGTVWNAVVAKTLDMVSSDNYPDMGAGTWIIDKYGDGIMYGILGRLMNMPAKPYTNAKLSKDYWQTYVTERGKARTDGLKANVFGGQRWMFPQGFATVRRGGWA